MILVGFVFGFATIGAASILISPMNASTPIRIFIVDDHPVLREGIAAVLESEPDMILVAEANNGREALEQFRIHRPDITLMDLQMPGVSGTEAILAIRKDFPEARIIVLTTYSGDALAARALKAGASGYLLKNMLRKELVETIRSVHRGAKKIPPEIAVEMIEHYEDALTEREIEVLRHVAAGNANKMIADRLAISEDTVKGHMRNILSKLGANDRTHAVTIALKRGIIDL
jgi:two-component system, NarL family, response regulator